MSVIGIDFGNESCFVAVSLKGGIETIANDYSLRATPSCVAFAGKNRILGVAAKNQQITNMKNTIGGFKRLLGRKFTDPHTEKELYMTPNKVVQKTNGDIGFCVDYMGEEHIFSPEQLTAMLFTKLKDVSANALQTQINDCVITVPFYYTNAERKALLDAAQIAGLNVLRLMNETTATALSYGFYRTDLPAETEKPRNVIFVDCGNSSIQVSACAFNKSKLKMLATTFEQVGGRDFDIELANHFSNEFLTKYKIDPRSNKRAYVRLVAEVEKLKRQMSANSTKLPLNIECLMNDIDVSATMQRVEFEKLCNDLFAKIENSLKKCLIESNLTLEDIHSVEIVGGSTRIPAIKVLIERIFGKVPCTTLNQDEAVSRGAALQCAIMSPAVRVREFGVTDIQNFPVKIKYDGENGQNGEMEVFPLFHAVPFSRMLSLYRREPIKLLITYGDPQNLPYPDPFIGQWIIKGIKPNEANEAQEIKIKVRVNHNGIILISSAQMVEKSVPVEEYNEGGKERQSTEFMDTQEEKSNSESEQKTEKKKKAPTKLVELSLEVQTHGFSEVDLNNYFEQELNMITNDRQEKERADARNALEEYVYDMRGKIQECGELYRYISDTSREKFLSELDRVENWLYEEGEDCERHVYKERLDILKRDSDPIKVRHEEYQNQPNAFEQLGHSIQMTQKLIDDHDKGDERYDHLTEAEIKRISETVNKAAAFLSDGLAKLNKTPCYEDPIIKLADIRNEIDILANCVKSISDRPKPKSDNPPTEEIDENVIKQNGGKNEKSAEDKMEVE